MPSLTVIKNLDILEETPMSFSSGFILCPYPGMKRVGIDSQILENLQHIPLLSNTRRTEFIFPSEVTRLLRRTACHAYSLFDALLSGLPPFTIIYHLCFRSDSPGEEHCLKNTKAHDVATIKNGVVRWLHLFYFFP